MNLEILSDLDLVNCMNNGTREKAFNVLYKRYNSLIYGFCLKLSRDKQLSEDFTQDTFSKLWTHSNTFVQNGDSGFKTWLYTIARNNFINHYRKEKRRPEVSFSDIIFEGGEKNKVSITSYLESLLENVSSADGNIINEEKYSYLKDAIENLKDKNSNLFDVINLRYFKGFSYKEIVKETGLSISQVKMNLHHAKKVLNKGLISDKSFLWDI
jgi:RNA polymerase sigma factor (sigma-70 family)